MKKYDYCFLIGSFPPFYPSGGDNVIFQLAKKLKNDNKTVLLLFLGDPYRKVSEFTGLNLADPNDTGNVSTRIFLKLFRYLQRSKACIPIFALLRIISKIDYDYSFLKSIDISILNKRLIKKVQIENGIASWWGTSFALDKSQLKVSKKYYLIQNQEDDPSISGDNHLLAGRSYQLDIGKIVVNHTLYNRFKSDEPRIMKIGLDHNFFKIKKPINERHPLTILISLRTEKYKGAEVGIETLKLLYKKYPNVKFMAFGNLNPKSVPAFVNYFFRPSNDFLRMLYNDSSIFIFPSIVEGMPIVPLEAMSCGCALVSTRNGGVEEYMPHDFKFLTTVNDPQELFATVSKLIDDDTLRISVANTCVSIAEEYTYEKMYDSFLKAIGNKE